MDSRTRLTLGGMATVAASVAVVCAVAMTTSAALADSAGTTVGAPVRVPGPTASAAASTHLPAAEVGTAPPAATPAPQSPVDQPETVPAPEPEDVSVTIQTPDTGEVSAATEDRFVEGAEVTGAWDEAYAWAAERGWPQARIDAWIARLESKLTEKRAKDAGSSRLMKGSDADSRTDPAEADFDADSRTDPVETDFDADSRTDPAETDSDADSRIHPAEADKTSGRDHSGPTSGSKREQSQVPPG